MEDEHAQFSGPIPAAYDRYLGPDVVPAVRRGSGGAMGWLAIFAIARRLQRPDSSAFAEPPLLKLRRA